jgi:hypothetical protein
MPTRLCDANRFRKRRKGRRVEWLGQASPTTLKARRRSQVEKPGSHRETLCATAVTLGRSFACGPIRCEFGPPAPSFIPPVLGRRLLPLGPTGLPLPSGRSHRAKTQSPARWEYDRQEQLPATENDPSNGRFVG